MGYEARKPLPANLRELRRIVWATGKTLTLEKAIELLRLHNEKIEQFDPEKKNLASEAEIEPRAEKAEKAVEFKLQRILELYIYLAWLSQVDEENPQDSEEVAETLFLAGDILLFVNDVTCHSLAHDLGTEVNRDPTEDQLDELQKRFHEFEDNKVQWNVAFGVAEQGGQAVGDFVIEAIYPGIDRETLRQNFNPETSAGIELLELQQEKYPGVKFKIKLSRDDEDGIVITPEFAQRMIVAKVPTEEMIAELRLAIMEQRPAIFADILFALGQKDNEAESEVV